MKPNSRCFSVLAAIACFIGLPVVSASIHQPTQQTKAKPNCPNVTVSCIDTVTVGDKLQIAANVTGGDQNVTPTYNWTVSSGTIESGQGTSVIQVNTSELTEGGNITATVDVGGFDRSCSTSSSCTTSIMKKVEARKLNEYGAVGAKQENDNLDNFVIELQNDPTVQGYIISYGGRASRKGDAEKAAARAKNYIVSKRGVDAARVVAIDGGLREQPTTELWVVPSGAMPPEATPTVKPGEAKPAKPKTSGKKS